MIELRQLNYFVAVAQDCGTDNPPTAPARPRPADTPAPPSPAEPAPDP